MPACHAVGTVIHDKGGYIDVPAGSVDKMVAANGQSIAIAHGHNNVQFWFTELHAGGKGQGATVDGMEAVKINIA